MREHIPAARLQTTMTLTDFPGPSAPSHQLSCLLPKNSPFLILFALLSVLHLFLQSRSHLLENFEKLLFRDSQIGCKVSGFLFP